MIYATTDGQIAANATREEIIEERRKRKFGFSETNEVLEKIGLHPTRLARKLGPLDVLLDRWRY